MKKEKKRLVVSLPVEVYDALKSSSSRRGVTMNGIICTQLGDWLDDYKTRNAVLCETPSNKQEDKEQQQRAPSAKTSTANKRAPVSPSERAAAIAANNPGRVVVAAQLEDRKTAEERPAPSAERSSLEETKRRAAFYALHGAQQGRDVVTIGAF
mgnify:CR=1 FL=1